MNLPTTINGYTLKQPLGKGGMATVYAAQNSLGKQAAVKMLHSEYYGNAQIRTRFKQDALIMAQLKHVNIREVYDFVEGAGYDAIVMEYLEGYALDEALQKQGKMKEGAACRCIAQAAEGLDYAHSQGFVHRDIKPSNLFLTKDGIVKIIDFGIAKISGDAQDLTRTSMQIGTPSYMSPEQIQTPKDVDARSDTYSLGVTLFTLLNGRKPYDEKTDSDFTIQTKIVKEALPFLPSISARTNNAIQTATQKDRQARPQNIASWAKALSNTLSSAADDTVITDVTVLDAPDRSGKKPHYQPQSQGQSYGNSASIAQKRGGSITSYTETESFWSWNGRINRMTYFLRNLALAFLFGIPFLILSSHSSEIEDAAVPVLTLIIAIPWFILTTIQAIKRWHDTNLSGWMTIFNLIPYINIIFTGTLLFGKGTSGENKYGTEP
ncbi:MAG: hypothetical protein RI894_1354 [Bacteroidota bacterium]|jgi:serine/threonine protein kinase